MRKRSTKAPIVGHIQPGGRSGRVVARGGALTLTIAMPDLLARVRRRQALRTADPGLSFNCPRCGRPLTYLETIHDTHAYRCPIDGRWHLPPHGRFEPAEDSTP